MNICKGLSIINDGVQNILFFTQFVVNNRICNGNSCIKTHCTYLRYGILGQPLILCYYWKNSTDSPLYCYIYKYSKKKKIPRISQLIKKMPWAGNPGAESVKSPA